MGSQLWQRIRTIRKAAKLTQDQLGKACTPPVTRNAVAQWEMPPKEGKRQIIPSRDNLVSISRATNVPIGWLLSDESNLSDLFLMERSKLGDQKVSRLKDIVQVPLLKPHEVGSNIMNVLKESHPTTEIYLPNKDKRENMFAMPVTNDVNVPEFTPGARVIVDQSREPQNGDWVVFASRNEAGGQLRQFMIDGAKRYLVPKNDKYPVIELTEDLLIIGVVIKAERDYGSNS